MIGLCAIACDFELVVGDDGRKGELDCLVGCVGGEVVVVCVDC